MQVTIEIPDAVVAQLKLNGRSVSSELLEAFAVEGYRTEKLSRGQVSELLGLNYWETEEFLRQRGDSCTMTSAALSRTENLALAALAMIVISDTSPINYMLQIGLIRLLHELFGSVIIPDAVYAELQHPGAPQIVSDWILNLPDWSKSRLSPFPIHRWSMARASKKRLRWR